MAGSRDPVLTELKKFKPARVRIQLGGGSEPVELHVTDKKNRWSLVRRSLEGYPNWLRLECCTKDGAILGIITNPEAEAGDLEDLSLEAVDDPLAAAVGNQMRIYIAGFDQVLSRTNAAQERTQDMMFKMLEIMSERIIELEKLQWQNLERAAADAFVSGEGASRMSDRLLEMMGPELMRKLMAGKAKGNAV